MSTDENAFGELIDEYIVECLPLAEQVGDVFIELERCWREDKTGADLLATAKSRLHTVKGNSAMMGLGETQSVAHALEDVCARLALEPELRSDKTAALLIAGSGLLIDLVRRAGQPEDPKQAAGFNKRVQTLLRRRTNAKAKSGRPLSLERRRSERADPDQTPDTGEVANSLVRVDFRKLDAMLEVLGEGMIEQAAVAELYRALARKIRATSELSDLDRAILALQKTMKRLEGILMETRLLPISSVFARFPRLVRDLAQTNGKQVHVVISGGDIPLDKAVLDRISEPLVHLLTNAVVHGIETTEERARAGKPVEGRIEITARSESGRVVMRLSDDGGGLDGSRILAKAQAMSLELQSTDIEHLQSLIFLPGFTTADDVSPLAGRGVGLHVVANTVHELGGSIEVESREGQGVSFTVSLPLTLAILRSLIVEVDRERYAVPLSHVAATVRTETDSIHQMNGQGVVLWRGDLIHVSDGGALLGTCADAPAPRRFYVVIGMGNRRRGILVDRLIGHQDIVVKSLDPAVGRPELVSGTTILGDGKVACILDIVGILDQRLSA